MRLILRRLLAMIPALLYLQHGRNPTLEADVLSWTSGWRDEALKS